MVRRVLELKRQLGLFQRRSVPLDSISLVVGRAEFQKAARDMAARSIVMVKDVGGTVHGLRRAGRPSRWSPTVRRKPVAGQHSGWRAPRARTRRYGLQALAGQRTGQLRFRQRGNRAGTA